jgi:hypothetical protein
MFNPKIKIDLNDMQRLENYRGYKEVWVYTPSTDNDLHIGYLDDVFFAYILPAYGKGIDIQNPRSVVDHYIDNIYFKVESIEINMVSMNPKFSDYKKALDSKRNMATVKHQSL